MLPRPRLPRLLTLAIALAPLVAGLLWYASYAFHLVHIRAQFQLANGQAVERNDDAACNAVSDWSRATAHGHAIVLQHGQLFFAWGSTEQPLSADPKTAAQQSNSLRPHAGSWWPPPAVTDVEVCGFGYNHWFDGSSSYRSRVVAVPCWAMLLLALIIATVSALRLSGVYRKRIHDRRVQSGLCPACGYDLRASPERCPECGRAVQSPADT